MKQMGTLLENCLTSVTGKILDLVAKNLAVSTVKSHGSHSVLKPKSIHTQRALLL